MKLSERRRVFYLILIMVAEIMIILGIAIFVLFRTAFDQQKERLTETAVSRARLIELVARFDAVYSQDYPEGSTQATFDQIADAHAKHTEFGRTGEFTLARREGDHMVFILRHRHFDSDELKQVPFDSKLAEPMRRALSGQSGTLVGLDYREIRVLAAYEPVATLDLGIVAQIDIVEIVVPFIGAGIVAGLAAVLVAILGSVLFVRISTPVLKRLQAYSERLEEMVQERTAELRKAQGELLKRERLAVLGQLAGGVGHELRNPLGVINNVAYYLNSVYGQGDEKMREHLQIISSEVRNAEKIVSDLLDLSRSKPPERQWVVLSEVVLRVLESYEVPQGVEVDVDVPEGLAEVYVDAHHVQQVLLNLVANGCQAMEEGGGVLGVSGEEVEGGVELRVTDSGCGIKSEDIARVFEPLFTTKARGIGLGLAVSKNLVEVNGGRIEVESEEGKGSTFRVFLPSERLPSDTEL